MTKRSISRVLAALLLAGLLENWRLVAWVAGARDLLLLLVGVTWLALVVVSVVGLLRARRWGAYMVLVLAPFSTVMLATPLFPGMHLLGLKGPIALAGWNLLALGAAIVVLCSQGVPDRGLAA
jgi:hypothetical protein